MDAEGFKLGMRFSLASFQTYMADIYLQCDPIFTRIVCNYSKYMRGADHKESVGLTATLHRSMPSIWERPFAEYLPSDVPSSETTGGTAAL